MAWCFVFVLTGAFSVALGIKIGVKLSGMQAEVSPPRPQAEEETMPEKLKRQWENLLSYDGSVQEEEYED